MRRRCRRQSRQANETKCKLSPKFAGISWRSSEPGRAASCRQMQFAQNIEMAQRKKLGEGKGDTKGETVREEKFARLRRKANPLVFPIGFPLSEMPKMRRQKNCLAAKIAEKIYKVTPGATQKPVLSQSCLRRTGEPPLRRRSAKLLLRDSFWRFPPQRR